MKLIPFELDKHYDSMTQLLKSREKFIPDSSLVPKWGCVVTEGDKTVSFGFLRQVEGGYAQIDSYVTNPEVSGPIRHRALELMTDKLIKYAKYKGITGIICHTEHNNTIKRASSHGFKLVSQAILALDLRSL